MVAVSHEINLPTPYFKCQKTSPQTTHCEELIIKLHTDEVDEVGFFSDVGLSGMTDKPSVTSVIKSVATSVTPSAGKIQQVAQEQNATIIEPIADLLPTNPNDSVIFVPQGELFLIPFPALKDANNQYLIEKHIILTAPSIEILALTHQQSLDNCRGVAFGGYDIGFTKNLLSKCFALSDDRNGDVLVVGNPTMPANITTPIGEEIYLSPLAGAEN